jgi:hypothetical protein
VAISSHRKRSRSSAENAHYKQKQRPWALFLQLPVLLLVTVLTKPLLALVRGHFMALALFTAWHGDLWMT